MGFIETTEGIQRLKKELSGIKTSELDDVYRIRQISKSNKFEEHSHWCLKERWKDTI